MLSQYGRTTFVRVSRKFRIVNSPNVRGDMFATLARQSFEIFWRKKISIKFLNMFKTFATSSRHMKIRDKIRKTVARNSPASEILALLRTCNKNILYILYILHVGRWKCDLLKATTDDAPDEDRTVDLSAQSPMRYQLRQSAPQSLNLISECACYQF